MDALLSALHRPSGSQRRWWPLLGIGAVAVAAIGWAAWPRPCGSPPDTVDRVRVLAGASEPDLSAELGAFADALEADWRGACIDEAAVARRDCVAAQVESTARLLALVDDGDLSARAFARAARDATEGGCDDAAVADHLAPPPQIEATVRRLRARLAGARALVDAGRLSRASVDIEAVRTAAEALQYTPLVVEAMSAAGLLQISQRREGLGEQTLLTAYWSAAEIEHFRAMAWSASSLAFLYGRTKRDAERAREWERHAQAAIDRLSVRTEQLRAGLANIKAANHLAFGEYDAAIELFSESIARLRVREQPAPLALALNNLGEALSKAGRYDEAEKALQESAALRAEHAGDGDVSSAATLVHLATLRRRQKRYDEAIDSLHAAMAALEDAGMAEHAWRVTILNNLGGVHGERGQFAPARDAFVEGIAFLDRRGETGAEWAGLHKNLALAYEGLEDVERARAHYDLALTQFPAGDPRRVETYVQLGRLEAQAGNRKRAESLRRRAWDGIEGPGIGPSTRESLQGLDAMLDGDAPAGTLAGGD